MIAALLALALAPQDSSVVQLGTVDVGGQQIAVEVPAQRGPFDENTPHVEIDGWKFTVSPEGTIGVRYKSDGGWGEVADAYPAAALKSATAPEYRIKVFILTNATILEHGHDGVWRRRRGAIGERDKQTILKSLARMKALAETAADGRVRLTFDVSYDDDLLFKTVEAGASAGKLLGSDFIQEDIAPRISNDPFKNEEGIYNGPYSSVFVIHPAMTYEVNSEMIERTPVTSVSWANFANAFSGSSLSTLLFEAWYEHLNRSFLARNGEFDHWLFTQFRTGTPNVFKYPISDTLLQEGNSLNADSMSDTGSWGNILPREFSIEDARELHLSRLNHGRPHDFEEFIGHPIAMPGLTHHGFLTGFQYAGRQLVFVPPLLAGRFMAVHPTAVAVGVAIGDSIGATGNQLIGFEMQNEIQTDNELSALDLDLPSIRAIPIVSPPETVGQIEFNATGHGDFDVAIVEDPVEGRVLEVSESGIFRRGHAVLASRAGSGSLFRVTESSAVQFKTSCDLRDAYVLKLLTDKGSVQITLFGDYVVPAEITPRQTHYINASKQPGPYWEEFMVSLPTELVGANVIEIHLAPPEYAGFYERKSSGKKSLKISQISFGPMTDTDLETVPTMDPDIEWLTTVQGSLDADARQRMTKLLQSERYELRLNALGAMSRIRSEELLLEIAVHLNSIDESEAYLAFQAMKKIGTDEAWAHMAYVITKGPMGHNYRFAAEALADKPEPATLQLMNALMLNRNWRTRRAAVQTIAKIDTEGAGVVASLALTSDPDPVIRYEITRQKRPNHQLFARRLLYTAVNDPFEWVRASSYLAILDSPFEDIRVQALRGVRDESITIRLTLLKAMRESPQAHYRTALQMAVVDSSPFVRAAALRAFATQPGEVVAGEIQNTFADEHPAVKQALAALLEAKNITVPPAR